MIQKDNTFVSLVFVVRNSEDRISEFFKTVIDGLDNHFSNYEIICVNNASFDNSISILKDEFRSKCNRGQILSVIKMAECSSFEDAVSEGIQLAIGDFVFEFDSMTIDYEPEMILNCYNELLTDIDIVSLSPNKKSGLLQRLYYAVYNFGVEKGKRIYPERMRIISRRAINRISSLNNWYSLSPSAYKYSGLKTKNLFYKSKNRPSSYDRTEFKRRLEKGIDNVFLHTKTFLKLFLVLALLFLAGGIVCLFFFLNVSFLLFALFAICVSSAVVLKYLSLTIGLTSQWKIQMVKSIDKVVGEEDSKA